MIIALVLHMLKIRHIQMHRWAGIALLPVILCGCSSPYNVRFSSPTDELFNPRSCSEFLSTYDSTVKALLYTKAPDEYRNRDRQGFMSSIFNSASYHCFATRGVSGLKEFISLGDAFLDETEPRITQVYAEHWALNSFARMSYVSALLELERDGQADTAKVEKELKKAFLKYPSATISDKQVSSGGHNYWTDNGTPLSDVIYGRTFQYESIPRKALFDQWVRIVNPQLDKLADYFSKMISARGDDPQSYFEAELQSITALQQLEKNIASTPLAAFKDNLDQQISNITYTYNRSAKVQAEIASDNERQRQSAEMTATLTAITQSVAASIKRAKIEKPPAETQVQIAQPTVPLHGGYCGYIDDVNLGRQRQVCADSKAELDAFLERARAQSNASAGRPGGPLGSVSVGSCRNGDGRYHQFGSMCCPTNECVSTLPRSVYTGPPTFPCFSGNNGSGAGCTGETCACARQ